MAKDLKKIAKEKIRRNKQTKKEVLALLTHKNEGGSLSELAGKKSIFDLMPETERDLSDDDEKYAKMMTDVKNTSDCINDLRTRMSRLEQKIDDLMVCFKGGDKAGTQASMISRLLRRKRLPPLESTYDDD